MKLTLITSNRRSDDQASMKTSVPVWIKRLAIGFTVLSCLLYFGLYFIVPEYRQMVEDHIKELPIFTRIVLNVYQPFLMVFILISIALIILFYLKLKSPSRSYISVSALITINFLVSLVLFTVTFAGIN